MGNVAVWGLSWTSLGGLGALDSQRSDQQILILYLRCLPQGSTQPLLLALAVPAWPHSSEVSLCQVTGKKATGIIGFPARQRQAGTDVFMLTCVSLCPDLFLPETRATLGLYTVPNLACRFLGNF